MFRRTLLSSFIVLSACAPKGQSEGGGASSGFDIPASCSFTQDLTNPTFLGWGVSSAKEYSCALFDKMTCTLYTSGDLAELQCHETNALDPQGPPSGCERDNSKGSGYAGSWMHGFLTGGVLYTTHYDCEPISSLSCTYHSHPGDACDDTNMSAIDDCDAGEDDEFHEDLRCVMN